VKVAGKRVDLFEIEEKLRALPGVGDAVVVARPDASGRGQQIVALAESLRPSAELMHALREALPSAAWPRVLSCVRSIPVTGAGKRDHDAIDRILSEVDK
jgi:mycobactin phenyloxazoline synthetase